eukprot:GHRR01032454.1.p1 GENE.GHRR01032454.1~~GHRR01032454.1.p1  ORF type:complete len:213 (+),score=76.27 GHRR01032454.1:102-740(+)
MFYATVLATEACAKPLRCIRIVRSPAAGPTHTIHSLTMRLAVGGNPRIAAPSSCLTRCIPHIHAGSSITSRPQWQQQASPLSARWHCFVTAAVQEAVTATSPASSEALASSQAQAVDAAAVAARSSGQLPKNFDFAKREQQLYHWWEQSGVFAPDMSAPGPTFTIPMPPPNVTGKLHMGHAMFITLQDVMARCARQYDLAAVQGTAFVNIAL